MSDELRLPDDLAACEARLAAMPLAASRIDRDQLMYQAGWAAALAGVGTTRLAEVHSPKRGILAASLTSAALAASLAVAVTLQWRSGVESVPQAARGDGQAQRQLADAPSPAESRAAAPRAVAVSPRRPSRDAAVEAALAELARSGGMRGASSALVLGRQGAFQRTAASLPAMARAESTASTATPKTARQMLEELLPAATATDVSLVPATLWPWSGLNSGEST